METSPGLAALGSSDEGAVAKRLTPPAGGVQASNRRSRLLASRRERKPEGFCLCRNQSKDPTFSLPPPLRGTSLIRGRQGDGSDHSLRLLRMTDTKGGALEMRAGVGTGPYRGGVGVGTEVGGRTASLSRLWRRLPSRGANSTRRRHHNFAFCILNFALKKPPGGGFC